MWKTSATSNHDPSARLSSHQLFFGQISFWERIGQSGCSVGSRTVQLNGKGQCQAGGTTGNERKRFWPGLRPPRTKPTRHNCGYAQQMNWSRPSRHARKWQTSIRSWASLTLAKCSNRPPEWAASAAAADRLDNWIRHHTVECYCGRTNEAKFNPSRDRLVGLSAIGKSLRH
jgi:hypothetical protein